MHGRNLAALYCPVFPSSTEIYLPRASTRRSAASPRGKNGAGVDETFPRLQILTLADLFQGKRPRIPNVDRAAFRRAAREATGTQPGLL